jgi:mono/diheme cytochrome c family protein
MSEPANPDTDRPRLARWPASALLGCLAGLLLPAVAAAAPASRTGEQIYRQQCASCHGTAGEGVKDEYGKPLAGDKSIAELSALIAKTMPADDPGTCIGPDARQVAAYIYDTFYSPVAQARNQPARIELSRLTVRQYRQSVADLVGSFRWSGRWGDERGLRAEYFSSRRFRKEDRVVERTDAVVDFDFGESSPLPEKIKPEEFGIKWQGGLLAPETGDYEFILVSENAARLWVNNPTRPLIDATVKSGSNTEHRETIRLLGGRVYPLRLETSKSKDAKEKSASIRLMWQLPHRADEVIPARNLSPQNFPPSYVVNTAFPPDDRSVGYERGTSISEAWQQATTDAALELSDYVGEHLADLAGVRGTPPDRDKRLREFCRRWVARAFCRPLDDEQQRLFIDRQFEQAADPDAAVKRVVLLSLLSPRFLYHDAHGPRQDGYDVATRLSLGLWDSLPDEQLLKAANSGRLATVEQVRQQAERMAGDLRARSKLNEFFLGWLNVERFADLAKDSKRFPEFDEQVVSDLRTALDLFLEDIVWSKTSDFRQLLLADWLYLNGRLGRFYGAQLPADAPFQKVTLQAGERAGVLTHPYLMAGLAYTATSSPIHRGVFVARSVLGRALRPPPEAVAPLPPHLHASLTTRERVALQTQHQSCQSCHRMINPLGFAFENFDAVGRFRNREQGKPIDSRGVYQTRAGKQVEFDDVHGLAVFLADSGETHAAFVEQLFHYTVKQPILAYGSRELSELEKSFAKNDYNMRKLMVDMVTVSALLPRDQRTAKAGRSGQRAPRR